MTPVDRRLAWLVAAIAFVGLAAGVPFGVPFSAGIAGALEILDGGWPYRDFWTIYAPGHFFLLAGLFGLLGKQLIVAALAAVVLEAVVCGLFFRLLRRLEVERRVAFAAALVVAAILFRAAPTLNTYVPALVCGIAAVTRVIEAAATGSRRDAFAAGAWLGAAAWFKHDVAGYVLVASAVSLVGTHLARSGPERARASGVRELVFGAAATALPVVLLVAVTAGGDAWRDLVVFPFTQFAAARPERYPRLLDAAADGLSPLARTSAVLQWVRHWAPVWAWLALLVTFWRWRAGLPRRLAAGLAVLVIVPLFFAAAHVQINTHILSMTAVKVCVLAVVWSNLLAGRVRSRVLIGALGVATLASLGAIADAPARSAARAIHLARTGRRVAVPGAAGVFASPREAGELEGAVRAVHELTAPGEPIWVGVARHDAVVTSRPELYLFLDRPNPTRYGELHPGVVDREPVQREIAADLDRAGVRVIVRWRVGWPDARFDEIRARRQDALPGTGATWLDEWIGAEFEPAARSGELEVLVRRART